MTRPLRVLMQLRRGPDVGASGLESTSAALANALRARGVEVDVNKSVETDLSDYDVVHLYNLPDAGLALRAFLNARRQNKPIVVKPVYWNLSRFENEGRALMREWAPELADGAGEERELAETSEALARRVQALALRIVYCGADLLMPQSASESAQLARDFGVATDALRVVVNGVDPRYAAASPEAFANKYGVRDFVLCVGRIDPRKNQYSLLKALESERLPIVLIGGTTSPEYLAACKRIAGPNVLFLAGLDASQIAAAGAAGRVHALVTWGETAGMAALEAGAAGCNLVMTTEGGGRDYLGEYAWYCDPGDRASIRAAVLAAYQAPRGRAREHILTNYTWERAAQETLEAYEAALERPRRAYDWSRDLEALVSVQSELAALQERRIETLWRGKAASEAYARQLANGRVLRLLRRFTA